MTGPLRCAVVDCRVPPTVGQLLCADHRPKPLTLRERIAKGPKFVAAPPFDPMEPLCIACGGPGPVDVSTGLNRACWVAWRWSSIREYEP